jgi:2'-5' RNA ligase
MSIDLSKQSGSEKVRTFLAIPLPEAEKSKFGAVQRAFDAERNSLKWVAPELLHITVKFLGGVAATRLQLVEAAAAIAAGAVSPFALTIAGLGAFPNELSPRVLWAGLQDDAGLTALHRLFDQVEVALAAQGFGREERRFSPHITLARARDTATPMERRAVGDRLAVVRGRISVSGRFEVRELIVMRSDLSRNGPVYTPLAIAPLGL